MIVFLILALKKGYIAIKDSENHYSIQTDVEYLENIYEDNGIYMLNDDTKGYDEFTFETLRN